MSTSATLPRTARPVTRPRPGRLRAGELTGFGFVAPFLVFYALFLILPLVLALIMSLFNTSLVLPGLGKFVGLSNYRELFGDSYFWQAMWHTVLFTLVSTPVLVDFASFLRDRDLPAAARSVVLPARVLHALHPAVGRDRVDLDVAVRARLRADRRRPSLLRPGRPGLAVLDLTCPYSVVIVTVWWTIGFSFVLFLAGLQEIPRDLYEAASLDGASWWTQVRRITIPMLGRTITLAAVLQVIASLKIFDQVYLITMGGPNYSTRTAIEYIYDYGFTSQRVGYASAASLVLFVVIMVIGFAWLALVRKQEKGV